MQRNINCLLSILVFAVCFVLSNGCSNEVRPTEVNYEYLRFRSSNSPAITVKSGFVTDISSFYTKGFYSDKSQWFPKVGIEEVEVGETYTEFPWREGAVSTFFAYANLNDDAAEVSITADGAILNTDIELNAADGTDIVLGRYTGDGKVEDVYAGTVSMEFFHPMASVVFKVGEIEDPADFKITRIGFANVYNSGQTSLTCQTTVQDNVAQFEWTNCSGNGRIQQIITGDLPSQGSQIGVPFFLIPQVFSEQEASVFINVEMGGNFYEFSIPLSDGAIATGKTTVYELNYTDAWPTFSIPTVSDWGVGDTLVLDI